MLITLRLTGKQELEADTQVCDECEHHHTECMWPKYKSQKACIVCSNRWVKCLIGSKLVTN